MNEKEKVYEELALTRRKLARLKDEVRHLQAALSTPQLKRLRAERDHAVKALSYIGHSPRAGDDPEHLKYVARLALLGKAWTVHQRRRNRAIAANGAAATDGDAARPLSGCPDGAEGSTPSRSAELVTAVLTALDELEGLHQAALDERERYAYDAATTRLRLALPHRAEGQL